MDGLSQKAKTLLKKVDQPGKVSSSGDAVRELEARLLVRATSVHTEHGFHSKEVQSWERWAKSVGLRKVKLTPAEAHAQLESVVARLNQQSGARASLPWQTKFRRSAMRPKL